MVVSIGLNVPVRHVEPAPVYVQPQPVYVQPRPTYYGHGDYGHRHYAQRSGPQGDWDRADRAPHNPYRY